MTTGTARALFALVVLAYIALFCRFSPLLVQDYPNHLARAVVMADLLFRQGAGFGQTFQLHLLLTPYVSGDLLLASLVQLTGVKAAAAIWAILTFLSLPAAVYVYLRARRVSTEVTLLMLFVSLYLSTDTFFVKGFFEYRLSIACVLVVLAMVELLRQRWSGTRFAIFTLLVVLAYLTHLAAIAFAGAAIGVSAVWRVGLGKARIDHELYLLIPLIGVLAWHFGEAVTYRQPGDLVVQHSDRGTVAVKIAGLSWDLVRYQRKRDGVVVAALLVFLLFYLRFPIRLLLPMVRRPMSPRGAALPRAGMAIQQVLEPFGYALLFLGMYIALPAAQMEATYIDVRALALVPFFGLVGLLNLPPPPVATDGRWSAPAIWLAAAVACVNLGYLAFYFQRENVWLSDYRAIVASLPAQSTVFPVFTASKTENLLPHLHAASFAVIDRRALIPYLFSGTNGSPMKYFRYVHRPYAPDELWYVARWDRDVDWLQVSRQYQYLLIAKPFIAERLRVRAHVVAENDAAALLAVE